MDQRFQIPLLNDKTNSLENIIFIICKKLIQMSYLSMIPNYYYSNGNQTSQMMNQYVLNQNNFNNAKVLNYLQTALKISVNNYHQNYHETEQKLQIDLIQKKSQGVTEENTHKVLENLQCQEENKENFQNNNEIGKQIAPIVETVVEDKENKKDRQSLTDDELLLEEKEKTAKKSQSSKRRGKKVVEESTSAFVVPIPEVNLLETAFLPLFPLRASEISKKREEIQMRKVADWNHFIKAKKDKRQIRMLCN